MVRLLQQGEILAASYGQRRTDSRMGRYLELERSPLATTTAVDVAERVRGARAGWRRRCDGRRRRYAHSGRLFDTTVRGAQ